MLEEILWLNTTGTNLPLHGIHFRHLIWRDELSKRSDGLRSQLSSL